MGNPDYLGVSCFTDRVEKNEKNVSRRVKGDFEFFEFFDFGHFWPPLFRLARRPALPLGWHAVQPYQMNNINE